MDNNALPANAIMGFAGWLTSRKEVSGPFSEVHDAAQMAQLVDEYCKMYGLVYDDEYDYRRHTETETQQDIVMQENYPGESTGMTPEDHIAWFFHDVMCSWAGSDVWMRYASACAEFPPAEHHLPPAFRTAWLRLVSIWKGR